MPHSEVHITLADRPPAELTQLIDAAADGNEAALDELAPLVYTDLKAIAAGNLRRNPGATMNTTALVNEAWLRLQKHGVNAHNRKHFFCIAAQAMRQILINEARAKATAKRDALVTQLTENQDDISIGPDQILLLDQILDHLQDKRPRLLEVFQMRYFLGMQENEVADILNLTSRTVRRDWLVVKNLIAELLENPTDSE